MAASFPSRAFPGASPAHPLHSLGFRWQHQGLWGKRGGDGLTLRDARAAAAPHPRLGMRTGESGAPAAPRLASSGAGFQGSRPQFPLSPSCHGKRRRRPARRSSLRPLTLRTRASPAPAAEFVLAASRALADVRQQVGRTPVGFCSFFFPLEPDGKGPFAEFLCNRSPAAPRAGRRAARGRGRAGWPASSRAGLGPGGPGRPASCPRRVPPAVLHAGARDPPAGAAAAPAHSIRTCRRTLSITEATT